MRHQQLLIDERAQRLALDPMAAGFELAGWAVRLASDGYLREWRILKPSAGIVVTMNENEALVWDIDEQCHAAWAARKFGGELAEVWESAVERLICWGNHIPAHRRIAADTEDTRHSRARRNS